jgi:hypothetical protein
MTHQHTLKVMYWANGPVNSDEADGLSLKLSFNEAFVQAKWFCYFQLRVILFAKMKDSHLCHNSPWRDHKTPFSQHVLQNDLCTDGLRQNVKRGRSMVGDETICSLPSETATRPAFVVCTSYNPSRLIHLYNCTHLVLILRITEPILPLLHTPSWCEQNLLLLYSCGSHTASVWCYWQETTAVTAWVI